MRVSHMLRRTRVVSGVLLLAACGSRTGLLAQAAVDASLPPPEAGPVVDASPDADGGADAPADAVAEVAPPCTLGRITGNVFGQTAYFANGQSIPPGRHLVRYVDGCMKYSAAQDWSVNAYALGDPAGSDHWWFIAAGKQLPDVIPPGTVGYLAGQGGYASFDDCVQANLALPPVELTLSGATLAVWLQDSPYTDNVDGPGGRSPTWSLECAP
jgi:hypothetical protein